MSVKPLTKTEREYMRTVIIPADFSPLYAVGVSREANSALMRVQTRRVFGEEVATVYAATRLPWVGAKAARDLAAVIETARAREELVANLAEREAVARDDEDGLER